MCLHFEHHRFEFLFTFFIQEHFFNDWFDLAFEDVVRLLDLARLLNRLGCDGTQANGLQEIHALFFEFVEADFLVVGSQVLGGS